MYLTIRSKSLIGAIALAKNQGRPALGVAIFKDGIWTLLIKG